MIKGNARVQRISRYAATIVDLFSDIKGVSKTHSIDEMFQILIEPELLDQDQRAVVETAIKCVRRRIQKIREDEEALPGDSAPSTTDGR